MTRIEISGTPAMARLAKWMGAVALLGASVCAHAAITLIPSTWNVIGLDSNSPSFGPKYFPVGVQVCSDTNATNVPVSFNWDSINPYINLRPGSLSTVTIPSIAAGTCVDAFFEVEVTQTSAAYDTTRRYHISSGAASTPTPRELYVEHLVSQGRNGVTDIRLNGTSIPAGGSMDLVVGNTYTITLEGFTATQGYNQLEAFINFSNTIFRVNSVSTNFSVVSAGNSGGVTNPYDELYADACLWENDPSSPNYLSCNGSGNAGGTVAVSYNVTILSGGGTSETLNTLMHDFSGSSFHYNSDYSFNARTANIVDPTLATITKNFLPATIAPGGTSTLTITLNNPNLGAIPGVSVTDSFPPGMTVASPLTSSTTCTGSPTITDAGGGSLGVGDTGIKITGASIPASSSCTLKVNVTAPSNGTYSNTTNPLIVNSSINTGKTATANLTVDSSYFAPPPPPSSCPGSEVTLATWDFSKPYSSTYAADSSIVSASATSAGSTTAFSISSGRYIGTGGWATNQAVPNANAPYIEFTLDTSKYGGVQIQYDQLLSSQSDWGGTNSIYTFSSADGGSWTQAGSMGAMKGAMMGGMGNVGPVAAVSTGSATTSFRVIAAGAKTSAAALELDNVVIKGCVRPNPPNIAKSFSPATIAAGATSRLNFSLTNPNATASLSGVKFTDALPAGVVVAATPAATTTCGGSPSWAPAAGSSALNFGQTTGATLAGGASCTVSVNVTAAAAGSYDNVSGVVSSTESGPNSTATGVATATLKVVAPPVIAKQFGPDPILTGGTSSLTFTVQNPNTSDAMAGVAFTDSFPAGMTVAASPGASYTSCGTPTFSPAAGAGSISFSGGSIAAGATCTAIVKVTATTGATSTTYTNTSGNVSHLINSVAAIGNTATDTLTVNPANPSISLLKQVATSSTGTWKSYEAVAVGSDVYFKFLVENTGDVPLSSVGVTDPASYISMAGCSWKDGDNNPLTAPFTLQVAGANNAHYATCVLGPITATSGSQTNTATAQGTYSATTVTDTASATFATTGLSLSKTATQTYFKAAGDVLNYNYQVSNTGAATLGTVTVSDNKTTVSCPSLTTVGNFDNFLNPGETITCTATYTVAAGDVTAKFITNTATATASSVNSNTANLTVPLAAELAVSKTNNVGGSIPLNQSFIWTLTLTNSPASGSSASFADTQTILLDNLPDVGATYAVGVISKAGATGGVNCTISSNTLTCKASGGMVNLPPGLTGTVTVSNGSTTVMGSGTLFSAEVAAGSKLIIAGVPYTVASVTSNSQLELTVVYIGANASGLSLPTTISVPITVTTTAGGTLSNPKSGGLCEVDPDNLVPEINDTNNSCADSVTVLVTTLVNLKTVQTISDPVNGTTNPKAIPGAVVEYTITITNTSAGTVDADSIVLTDAVPANTQLLVCSDPPACTNATPPITFICSTTPDCGLTYTHNSDVSYSNTPGGGAPYTYTPSPDANGYDNSVTGIRLNPKGAMSAATPPNNSSFSFKIRMQIK